MIHRKQVPKTFYEKRDLAVPREEYWPEGAGELRDLCVEPAQTPRVLLGDGQHVRSTVIGERTFDVVRTEKCKRVLSVDRESKIVRVEAGIRWGELQAELAERGLSLDRYRLYPATATIGGLLARHHPLNREMWDGDIRGGCCALSAVSPGSADYRYIAAPRKASGPDLRHLYIGGEGLVGAILDVTLVVWAPSPAQLFEWRVEGPRQAVEIAKKVFDAGIRISWSHYVRYKSAEDTMSFVVHAPARLLRATESTLRKLGLPDFEVGDDEAVSERRRKLEAGHPDRRILASARRTTAASFSLHDLADTLEALPEDVEGVEVWDWTRHNARAYIRYAHGKIRSELPGAAGARALEARPVLDDEAVHWPHWAQALKHELDPDRDLAVGP